MRFFIKILFCLVALGNSSLLHSQKKIVLDEVIGVVGDEIVTKSEVEAKYSSMISQGMVVTDNSRCEVLEDVLYTKILLNQAKVDSVEVTDGQVDGEMDRRMRYFVSQFGSEEAMESYYEKSISQIKEEMRKTLKEQLLVQSMQGKLTSKVQVTPAEVQEYYHSIPQDSLPLINAEVEIAQIIKYAPPSKASIQEVRDRLEEFKKRVEEGENFATLAVLYSEDKGSALKGGEIGFVGRAEVQPEFSAASFKLKPGNVSPIVKTKFGYHIIQMIERRGDKVNVRHILLKPKQDYASLEKVRVELDSIGKLIANDSNLTFERAAMKFSDDEETKRNGGILVSPYNSSSMIPMDELDPSIFFVIDKLKVGEVSTAVQIQDQGSEPGYKLIKLNKRTDPHRASLKLDYQKVKNAAKSQKEQTEVERWIKGALGDTYIKLDKEYTEGCKFAQDWKQFAN